MTRGALITSVAATLLMASIPFLPFRASGAVIAVVYAFLWHTVLALSYDLVGGQMGYINLGHVSFFGIGAYSFGISLNAGMPLSLSFLLAICGAAAFATVIAFPFFRLKGAYFSLATFSLVLLLHQLALNLRGWTGGSDGLYLPSGFRDIAVYYGALLVALAAVVNNYLISRSGFGLALASIREDEEVAESFGVDLFKHKLWALVISSTFPGMMGALFAWQLNFVNPDLVFGLEKALVPVLMAMLGGTGMIFGPILGAAFLLGIEQLLWTKMAYLHLFSYGLILALIGIFMPRGLIPSLSPVAKRLLRNASRVRAARSLRREMGAG